MEGSFQTTTKFYLFLVVWFVLSFLFSIRDFLSGGKK